MFKILTAIICTCFIVVFVLLRRWFTFWTRQGIKVPSFLEHINRFCEPIHIHSLDMSKYGKVYGGFGLTNRWLAINDPELIKSIFVENFNVFADRMTWNFGQNPYFNKISAFMPGNEDWKRIRSVVSPAFTSSKLKAMMVSMCDITDGLIKKMPLSMSTEKPIDLRPYISALVIDVISSCAYGIKTDSIDNPKHPIVTNLDKFFSSDITLRRIISIVAPKLARWLKFEFFDSNISEFFSKLTEKILIDRKSILEIDKDYKRTDLLKILIDSEDYESHAMEKTSDYVSNGNQSPIGKLTLTEITAQVIMFYIASYEATVSALAHIIYYLAKYQECQQKIFEEIKSANFSYEELHGFKYLSAFIDESLRLSPSAIFIPRVCVKNFKLKGIDIPSGTSIEVWPYVLHRDPDYWTHPLEFKPERFLNPTHPSWAYLPFGGGPRICPGQQFGALEMRIFLVKLLQNFKICPVLGFELDYLKGYNVFLLPQHLFVNIEPRCK